MEFCFYVIYCFVIIYSVYFCFVIDLKMKLIMFSRLEIKNKNCEKNSNFYNEQANILRDKYI